MRITGSEFRLSLDGNEVERWNDARIPSGGVGFFSDGEDRARLYWVRMASSAVGVEIPLNPPMDQRVETRQI
jgi:hypothetical protein